jgi:uncharacterized protein YybS (DUF2232 family)
MALTLKDRIITAVILICIIITYVWLILKQFGYIHTPWFITAIPFTASTIAIVLFIYHACVFIGELRPLPKQMVALTKRVDRLEESTRVKFEHVDDDLEFLKKSVTR